MNEQQTTTNETKTVTTEQAVAPKPETLKPAVAEVATVPEGAWPGAFGIYKYSKAAVMFNLSPYLYSILIPLAISILLNAFNFPEALGNLINTVVNTVLSVAVIIIIMAAIGRQKVEFGDAFKQSASLLSVKMFALSLLIGLIALGSFLLLIVPFFFIFPRVLLAPYFLVDKGLDISESIVASWSATKGHLAKIYGIMGVNIIMCLLFITIIGIPIALYLLFTYSAAYPILYTLISKDSPAADSTIPATEANTPAAQGQQPQQ